MSTHIIIAIIVMMVCTAITVYMVMKAKMINEECIRETERYQKNMNRLAGLYFEYGATMQSIDLKEMDKSNS